MLIPMIMMTAAMQTSSPPPAKSSACAKSDTVKLTPADTLQRLDDFRTSLPASDRLRLDRALPRNVDGGIAQCDAVEGSRASCEASAYMPALRTTGLMPRFLATICPKP
jgi:hypothetical protein